MKEDPFIKILFLPAWYPHKHDPMFGLFVRQHANTLQGLAEVSVVNVVQVPKQDNKFVAKTNVEEGLTEIIIYYRSSCFPLSPIKRLQNLFRYFTAQKMGYDIIQASKLTPNICHVHVLTRAGLAALYLKKFKKIPYVITEHWSRYFPHNDHFTNPFHKWVTRKIVRNASAMTTVSDTLRKAMQQKGIQHPDWSLLPNVIDVNRFTPVDKMHNSQHTKILHVSCFEDKSKNISGMLRAYAKSLTHSPNMELVLVGDGPDFEELKAYSKELGIRDQQIRFTGVLQKQALIDQMNDCDFSMLFSNYETFGIVVLESIALGKPVIASNAGALPEVLPSNCGMLVEKGDEEALCKAILKMAQEYAHYDVDEMHAFVAEHYDTKVIGYQLINLYKKHINNA